jgi:hypothetical protein
LTNVRAPVLISSLTAMISTLVTADPGTTALSLAATAGLMVLLVARELADTGQAESLKVFRRHLLAFAMPLLVVFAAIAVLTCVSWFS